MKRRSPAGMPGRSRGRAVSAQGYCVPGGGAISAGYQSSPGAIAGIAETTVLTRTPRRSSGLTRVQAAKDLRPQRCRGGQIAHQERHVRELEEESTLGFCDLQGLLVQPLRLAQIARSERRVALALQADHGN